MSMILRAVEIDHPGRVDGRVLPVGREERRLVDARGLAPCPTRFGSSTSGVPWRTTASITVHQHTPSSRATTATGRASSPTWRVASAPARSGEHRSRGDVLGCLRSRSWPHSRDRHSATGASARPAGPGARSRAGHGCRPGAGPWPRPARHRSDTRRSRPSSRRSRSPRQAVSSTASTRKPSSPNSASARPVASSIVRGPPRWVVEQPQRWRDPWPRWWTLATSRSPVQREEPDYVGVARLLFRRRMGPAVAPCLLEPFGRAPSWVRPRRLGRGRRDRSCPRPRSGWPPTSGSAPRVTRGGWRLLRGSGTLSAARATSTGSVTSAAASDWLTSQASGLDATPGAGRPEGRPPRGRGWPRAAVTRRTG